MKLKVILSTLCIATMVFTACGQNNNAGNNNNQAQQEQPNQTTPPETTPDVVTTASIVNTPEAFEKAISDTGSWIIATVGDITFDKEITLNGEFNNGRKDDEGKDIIQRKIALYTQDENREVTDRFTLTAPKFNINSPKASIQHGTFKGDLYVSANDFELVDTTVDGNIYFANEEAQSTFKMDDASKVTGTQGLATENQGNGGTNGNGGNGGNGGNQ